MKIRTQKNNPNLTFYKMVMPGMDKVYPNYGFTETKIVNGKDERFIVFEAIFAFSVHYAHKTFIPIKLINEYIDAGIIEEQLPDIPDLKIKNFDGIECLKLSLSERDDDKCIDININNYCLRLGPKSIKEFKEYLDKFLDIYENENS